MMLTPSMTLALWLAAAPPSDPEQALAALRAIGEAPDCVPTFRKESVQVPRLRPIRIVRSGGDAGAEPSEPVTYVTQQREVAVPRAPEPRLKGRTAEILPFAAHANRRVVQRAVALLCAVQDAAARAAIRELATGHPCFRWLDEALYGAGIEDLSQAPRGDCAGAEDEPIPGEVHSWAKWVTPEARALARRLSAGEEAALRQALADREAMDLRRVRSAVAALALIDQRPGWVRLAAQFPAADHTRPEAATRYLAFVQGLGPHTLKAVAAANKHSLAEEIVAVLLEHPELEQALYYMGRSDHETFGQLGILAGAARKSGRPRQLLEWFELIEDAAVEANPGIVEVDNKVLEKKFKARDAAGLRAFLKDERHRRVQRLYAGSLLAQLGHEDGLDLFAEEKSVRSTFSGAIASELRDVIAHTSGKVRERARELLRLYEGEAEAPPGR